MHQVRANTPLARAHFRVGQVLQVDHFQAIGDSVLAEQRMIRQLRGPASVGLARWQLDERVLAQRGVLLGGELVIVMPSGLLVAVDSGELTETSSANAVWERGDLPLTEVTDDLAHVYLHRLDGLETRKIGGIEREFHRLRLSLQRTEDASAEHISLGAVARNLGDRLNPMDWAIAANPLPPLLGIAGTPHLRRELAKLDTALGSFGERLAHEVSLQQLAGQDAVSVGNCLKEIFRFRSMLGDVHQGNDLHPQELLNGARELYFELYFHQRQKKSTPPASSWPNYNHHALGPILADMFQRIHAVLVGSKSSGRFARLKVSRLANGRRQFANQTWPTGLESAKSVYLLAERAPGDGPIAADDLKLGEAKWLEVAQARALPGVRLRAADLPSFVSQLGGNWSIFHVDVSDPKWAEIIRQRSLATVSRDDRVSNCLVAWQHH